MVAEAVDLIISRTYRAKPGSHYTDHDAAVIGPALTEITAAQGGSYKPEDVVAAARAAQSPLHPYFEWDNKAAAEAYRVEQAKAVSRAIIVEFAKRTPTGEATTQQTRGWVSLTMPDDHDGDATQQAGSPASRRYVPIETVIKTPSLTEQLLMRAKAELAAFRARYEQYADLPEFFALRPVLAAITDLQR